MGLRFYFDRDIKKKLPPKIEMGFETVGVIAEMPMEKSCQSVVCWHPGRSVHWLTHLVFETRGRVNAGVRGGGA